MATLTLKNVPLEEAVAPPPFDPEAFLARVDAFRERLAERGVWVTEERLREAIEEGRP